MMAHGNSKGILILTVIAAVLLMLNNCNSHDHGSGHDHAHEESHQDAEPKDSHSPHGENGHEEHAEDDHHARFENGKAITAADEHRGIQLSAEAREALGITVVPLSRYRLQGARFRVPVQSLIEFRDKHAIFIHQDGWYRFIPVSPTGHTSNRITVVLKSGDSSGALVVKGAPLLRLAHVVAFDAASVKHTH